MKRLYILSYTLMLLYGVLAGTYANAQNVRILDIEKSKDAYANNSMYTTLDMFAELNGVFYFNSNDGIHGNELWRSDGTTAGTWMVKDINPDTASANVNDIVVSGNKLFFSASDGFNGQQLWVSDGTADGTQMIPIFTGSLTEPHPSYITDVNGTAFFAINSFDFRNQIWRSDGTPEGTMVVADFSSFNPFFGNNIRYLTNVNGKLFFTANNFFGSSQLFVSDGTLQGTTEVDDQNFFGIIRPSKMTALNGLLYFSAYNNGINNVWVSDGTSIGTHPLKNKFNIALADTYDNDNEQPFTIKDNTLLFQGAIAPEDYELCKYDASDTASSVRMVKDVTPGLAGSYPANIINVNGTVFFTTGPAGGDAALWKTDGTTNGTRLVRDINPGGINYYYGLVPADSIVMFAYDDGKQGFELWKSDGTAAGTVLVKDIFPGVYSSFPQFITYHGDQFLFTANDGSRGFELWKSDGTKAGTTLIKNINTSFSSSSYPSGITALNSNTAVFTAGTNQYGFELWRTNGFDIGTKIVKDIYPGAFSSYPQFLTNFKNSVYFFAGTDSGYYLGKTNGTDGGTSLFYRLNVNGYVENTVATDNLLYFTVFNYTFYRQELWRTNGTAEGTYAIRADLNPYYASTPVGAGNTLFFVNYDFNTGYELWESNGTTIGTKLVKDINPGINSSSPFNLFNFNGKLYFAADNGYGPFLWTSDGTSAGTKQLKAIIIQSTPFAQANGKLFFSAYSMVSKGAELYATDGTSAGTKLVKDVNKGPASSNPYSLVNGNSLLYFLANQNDNFFDTDTSQLWASTGTPEGTHLVTTLSFPVSSNPDFAEKVNVNDKLFFTFNNTLWQSDATEAGTHQVNDPTLNGVSGIYNLSSIGNKLYFTGFSYTKGQELYVATIGDASAANNISAALKAPVPDISIFDAKLLSNPIGNQLKMAVNVKDWQSVQVIVTDALGRILTAAKQTLPVGSTILSYDTKGWAQGLYMIKIVAADGHGVVLKAVK